MYSIPSIVATLEALDFLDIITAVDLLDAEVDFLDAEVDLLDAEVDFLDAAECFLEAFVLRLM